MKNNLVWVVVGVVVLGGAYLWQGGQSERAWGPRMMGAGIDRHFIEEMIPHHEGAIAMAELALERSKRTEVLSLANTIIEAQTKEISDMRAWYRDWFGAEVSTDSGGMMQGGMHMRGMGGDLDALQAVPNFDKEFLSQMIVHHEMAVMMARMLAAGTTRSEMQALAENIITSQLREIELMQSWLTAW